MFSVEKKVAIVTGAARGNGFAIAKGLLDAGAIVYFVDVLDKEIKFKNAFYIKADINDVLAIKKIVAGVIKKHKRIDILVNNAGISTPTASENYSTEDWDRTLNTNLRSPFLLSQLVAKEMIKTKNGGSIINITSLNTRFGFSNNPAYVVSKSGFNSLTRVLAKDWAKFNIRVNNVCPGYIHTDMTKISYNNPKLYKERIDRAMIKRFGEPEDLVGAVIFLSSQASAYITGVDLFVDGGWSASGI